MKFSSPVLVLGLSTFFGAATAGVIGGKDHHDNHFEHNEHHDRDGRLYNIQGRDKIAASDDPSIGQLLHTDLHNAKSWNTDPDQFLPLHNNFRALCSAPPLTWNNTLAEIALYWAANLTNTRTLTHSPGVGGGGPFNDHPSYEDIYKTFSNPGSQRQVLYGENLASLTGSEPKFPDAFNLWIDERKNYSPADPINGVHDTSDFTQVVWKSTRQVGCASVVSTATDPHYQYRAVYVCEYYPPGNWVSKDEHDKNVQLPSSDPPKS